MILLTLIKSDIYFRYFNKRLESIDYKPSGSPKSSLIFAQGKTQQKLNSIIIFITIDPWFYWLSPSVSGVKMSPSNIGQPYNTSSVVDGMYVKRCTFPICNMEIRSVQDCYSQIRNTNVFFYGPGDMETIPRGTKCKTKVFALRGRVKGCNGDRA